MTNFNSISDMSRSYQLRLANSALKSKLNTLTAESASGIKQDIAAPLGGDLSRITQIESRIKTLAVYERNIAEAQSILSGMQNALGNIKSMAANTGINLISDAIVSSEATLDIYLNKAPDELRSVINALNTSVAGRYLFSGSNVDVPAIDSYEHLIEQIRLAVGSATSTTGIKSAIDEYFDDPVASNGFINTVYLGGREGTSDIPISPENGVHFGFTAASAEVRQAIKGFATLAYISEEQNLDYQTRREVAKYAGLSMTDAEPSLTSAQSILGATQESAEKILRRNQTYASQLAVSRNEIVTTDPYHSATALKEVEDNIEALYALIARLSKLSLTDYL